MTLKYTIIIALSLILSLPLSVSANNIFSGELIIIAAQSHNGTGTVTKIDKKGKRVELNHGPIKSIGWMSMQMYFDIEDVDMLDDIKTDDTVNFEFIKTRDNRYVITDIENDG